MSHASPVAPAPDPRIDVVVPVRNEVGVISRLLECTRARGVRRVIVDGDSTDGTAERARELGAECVVRSGAGRARQLRAGLAAAEAEVVLFLHADTRLEAGWPGAVRSALSDPAVAGGAFRLAFDSRRRVYRMIEGGAHLRARLAGLPYGDQGLFARRLPLVEAGGIDEVPIFEDLDLARRIRRLGRLVILRERAWTSPRRYERNGIATVVVRNNLALAGWALGLERERVSRWYRRAPRR